VWREGSTATDPSNLGSHGGGERTPVPVSVRRRRSITTTSNHAAEYDTATLTAASTSIPTMTTDHSARAGETGHYAPVKYVRIFADEQGLSHFEDVELDLKRRLVADGVPPLQLVGPLAASGILFVEQMGEPRFTNVATFRDGRMAGESLYFDLATLCEQAGFLVDAVRAAAKERAPRTP
jgi:hypothetical protein